jgi:hypothetical protein
MMIANFCVVFPAGQTTAQAPAARWVTLCCRGDLPQATQAASAVEALGRPFHVKQWDVRIGRRGCKSGSDRGCPT